MDLQLLCYLFIRAWAQSFQRRWPWELPLGMTAESGGQRGRAPGGGTCQTAGVGDGMEQAVGKKAKPWRSHRCPRAAPATACTLNSGFSSNRTCWAASLS